jgi:hypothetical protein
MCDKNIKINGLMFLPELTNTHYIYINDSEFNELRNEKFDTKQLLSYTKFLIKKTEVIDVYELYDSVDCNQRIGIAHIPDMVTSHYFRDIFMNVESTFCQCIYSTKFKQWVPVCNDKLEYAEILYEVDEVC